MLQHFNIIFISHLISKIRQTYKARRGDNVIVKLIGARGCGPGRELLRDLSTLARIVGGDGLG